MYLCSNLPLPKSETSLPEQQDSEELDSILLNFNYWYKTHFTKS